MPFLKKSETGTLASTVSPLQADGSRWNGRDVTQLWDDTKSSRDARVYPLVGIVMLPFAATDTGFWHSETDG